MSDRLLTTQEAFKILNTGGKLLTTPELNWRHFESLIKAQRDLTKRLVAEEIFKEIEEMACDLESIKERWLK